MCPLGARRGFWGCGGHQDRVTSLSEQTQEETGKGTERMSREPLPRRGGHSGRGSEARLGVCPRRSEETIQAEEATQSQSWQVTTPGRQADAGPPPGGEGRVARRLGSHIWIKGACAAWQEGLGPDLPEPGAETGLSARERYNELYSGGKGVPRSRVAGKMRKGWSGTVCGRQLPWFRRNIIHLLCQQSLDSYKPGTGWAPGVHRQHLHSGGGNR